MTRGSAASVQDGSSGKKGASFFGRRAVQFVRSWWLSVLVVWRRLSKARKKEAGGTTVAGEERALYASSREALRPPSDSAGVPTTRKLQASNLMLKVTDLILEDAAGRTLFGKHVIKGSKGAVGCGSSTAQSWRGEHLHNLERAPAVTRQRCWAFADGVMSREARQQGVGVALIVHARREAKQHQGVAEEDVLTEAHFGHIRNIRYIRRIDLGISGRIFINRGSPSWAEEDAGIAPAPILNLAGTVPERFSGYHCLLEIIRTTRPPLVHPRPSFGCDDRYSEVLSCACHTLSSIRTCVHSSCVLIRW
ncbi:hypothetical protein KCU83_g161, partial [Aureobasidium melanogenum]